MSGNLEQRLWEAIEDKDFRKARSFLRKGAKADKLLKDGIAVIHFLSGIEEAEANQLLIDCLEHGASPNIPSGDGITPIHVAAIWGNLDNLSTLIEYGGNINARDADEMSPLDYAKQSEECQAKDCTKLLTDLMHDNATRYTYTKIKSKPKSGTVNKRQDFEKCAIGNKGSLATRELEYPSYLMNPSGLYYMDERDLMSEDETSMASNQTTVDNEFSSLNKFTCNKNRKTTRSLKNHHATTLTSNPDRGCFIDGRDFMTEDEGSSWSLNQTEENDDSVFVNNFKPCTQTLSSSKKQSQPTNHDRRHFIDERDLMTEAKSSSDSLSSTSSSSTFHTAYDEEISMAFTSVLDDTVTFPKLHPWTLTQTGIGLDDTVIDGINDLDLGNTSENREGTSRNIAINTSLNNTLSDGTVLYDWKEYSVLEDTSDASLVIPESLLSMGCQQLREELLKVGDDPGPVRADTRVLYVRKLARIQCGLTDRKQGHSNSLKEYLPEVRAIIEGRLPSPVMDPVEESMCVEFTKNHLRSKWREGTEKSSFNYLLLDPRVTQNLPVRSKKMAYEDIFHTFVAAIFYVGKGKRSRPYAHLHEATSSNKTNRKLQQIRDIWSAGLGVVSLHCFQGVIPVEAYTREACLVEALGLTRLTNQKRCDYYGRAKMWNLKKKRQMGVSLLKRALQIFLNEGERQMRPEDLRKS